MKNRLLLTCLCVALILVAAVMTITPHSYGQNRPVVKTNDPPANPNASADARAVLAYLQAQPENCAIIAGQNVNSGEGMADDYAEVVAGLHDTTGQWVGLLGVDYYDYDDDHADYAESNPILIDYWQAGGLVSLSWSIPNPWTGGDAWDMRNADLTELLDANAPAHSVWMAHLDNVADALTALREAGVVVLWRPLHEMNGYWFWWSSVSHPGNPAPYQALWRQMFDYFTYTRGLDNLLWVYSAAGDEPWGTIPAVDFYYPGSDYVDVVGQSIYSGTLDQFHIYSYDELLSLGKPVALTEFGPGLTWMEPQDGDYDYLILLDRLRNRYPQTVYWLSWHDWVEDGVPVYISIVNNLNANALMNDACVTTRDEIDWHSYLAPTPTSTPTRTPTSTPTSTPTPPSAGSASIFYTERAPTVDGRLDSRWARAATYTIGKTVLGQASTQSNLSASFKALYDADALHLFVDITDNQLVQDSVSQWWEDDAVEIYLDGDLSRGQTYDGVDDYQLILRWDDDTVYVGGDSVPAPADLDWAYRRTDKGWSVEIAFPWSVLGITARPGIQFGLDVHVSDDDDGGDTREQKLAWHADRDDAWFNPSLLGVGKLRGYGSVINLPLLLTYTAQTATPTSSPTPTPEAPETFETLEPQGTGLTYYVSGTGNDGNSGLSGQEAFRTLQRAANLTQPGDTVLVMNGVYTVTGSGASVLYIETSGTADNWIRYLAYPEHQPHILVEDHWAGILVGGASYILIDGFTVEGNAPNVTLEYALQEMSNLDNPITSSSCIAIREYFADPTNPSKQPHHVIVRNNHVFNCPGGGIESLHADYLRIEDNLVHHNAFYTPYASSGISIYLNSNSDDSTATKMFVRRNISFKNENKVPHYYSNPDNPDQRVITDGNGIIIDDTRNVQSEWPKEPYTGRTLVENNLVYDNGGRGILVYLSENVVVRNNTSYQNARTPIMPADMLINNVSRVEIYGNIVVARPDRISVDTYLLNQVSFHHNLYAGGTGHPNQTESDIVADPEFVRASIDPTPADFRLRASSPAIDQLTTPHAGIDLEKTPRPQGAAADLGAYEYHATSGR